MADGIKGAIQQTATDLGEAVVKPVVDEVGKALEEGVQTVVQGTPALDPVAQQKKQQDEQKRIVWARKVIDWNKKIEEDLYKIRQDKKQQEAQKQQEVKQEQKVKQYKVVEKQQKQAQLTQAQLAARKTELRGGVGG